MEQRLRKVRLVILWLTIGWIGFFALMSFWLKYRMEARAKDMLTLRLIDAIDLYRSLQDFGIKQDVLDQLIQRQLPSFRIGRLGFIMHVKDHTIVAASEPHLNGQPIPDIEFPGGIEEGNFFKMSFNGENHLVAMEKVDKLYILGLLPYSEIYNDFYRCMLFLSIAEIAYILCPIFLYRKIQAELLAEEKQQGGSDNEKLP